MSKERFAEILRDYDFSEERINFWWYSKSAGPVDEARLRRAAEARRTEIPETEKNEQAMPQAA